LFKKIDILLPKTVLINMENTFRTQLYQDIFDQYSEQNRVVMCNLVLNKHEIQHYSLHNNHTINPNHYIVTDTNIRNICSEVVENKTCTHEKLISILDNLSENQLSIIGF
jgi:hypothetical protein